MIVDVNSSDHVIYAVTVPPTTPQSEFFSDVTELILQKYTSRNGVEGKWNNFYNYDSFMYKEDKLFLMRLNNGQMSSDYVNFYITDYYLHVLARICKYSYLKHSPRTKKASVKII